MKYSYNYTIRRKDFKEVVVKRISYIESLDSKIFEKNSVNRLKKFKIENNR